MKKKLYLVRHGQTLFNRKGLIQGWCDSPLTPFGHLQAQATKEWLKENQIFPESFYCSPLNRTEETLKEITDQPYQKLDGIKEMYYGELEGEEISRAQRGMERDPMGFYVQFGGEHRRAVGQRMYKTISEIMKTDPAQTILMCTHGACSFQFARLVDDAKAKALRKFNNCTIYEFEYDDQEDQFTLLNVFNEHVKDLKDPNEEEYQKFYQNKNQILEDLGKAPFKKDC